jgi:predicted small lipoprotein YifL
MSILRRILVILAAFAFLGLVSACGQTGPLYMPGQTQPPEPKSDSEYESQSDLQIKPR